MIMSILFHIFVVLIGFSMTTKENINVPGATAILTLRAETDKPFAEGTSYFITMKMIEDLKQQFPHPNSKQKRHLAIYECPVCGRNFTTWVESVKRGSTRSCGCSRKGVNSTHKLSKTRLYMVWAGMKARCNYGNSISYVRYGARGIKVCPEWEYDFMSFYIWAISHGYKEGLEIDREDNNGDYTPENCRWVTKVINCQNTRRIRSTNTSGNRGVRHLPDRNRWIARIHHNGKMNNLGYFREEKDAIKAYNNFIIKNKTNHPLN